MKEIIFVIHSLSGDRSFLSDSTGTRRVREYSRFANSRRPELVVSQRQRYQWHTVVTRAVTGGQQSNDRENEGLGPMRAGIWDTSRESERDREVGQKPDDKPTVSLRSGEPEWQY